MRALVLLAQGPGAKPRSPQEPDPPPHSLHAVAPPLSKGRERNRGRLMDGAPPLVAPVLSVNVFTNICMLAGEDQTLVINEGGLPFLEPKWLRKHENDDDDDDDDDNPPYFARTNPRFNVLFLVVWIPNHNRSVLHI